jgi:hypothetical protein
MVTEPEIVEFGQGTVRSDQMTHRPRIAVVPELFHVGRDLAALGKRF